MMSVPAMAYEEPEFESVHQNEVYEILVEDVSPGKWEEYLAYKGDYLQLFTENVSESCELTASWKFIYGDVKYCPMIG